LKSATRRILTPSPSMAGRENKRVLSFMTLPPVQ
jgi:hypothetical protein